MRAGLNSHAGRARVGPALALALLLTACASAPEPQPRAFSNPVLDRDFPDPAVLRSPDGWIYAYATQGAAGGAMLNIQVARSRDLVDWEYLGDALPEKPRWAATKQNFWAPHVVQDRERGRYVMYYSAEPDEATGRCLAVATSAAPPGPFVDAGQPLLCGKGIEHIDPMAFEDPQTGRRFLYWGSGGAPLVLRELAPDGMAFLPGSVAVELLGPDRGRRYRSLIEGAWIHHREGRYFLFFSGDRCCGKELRYAVMAARSDSPFGPFEVLETPILEAGDAWRAPGHNSVMTDDAGNDWIVYHAYSAEQLRRGERSRVMLVDRIEYRDGWPRIDHGRPSTGPSPAPRFR